jgi:hypothetical protein
MINKNTKNAAITTAIIGVVPQPGATLPYSEFKGRKSSPNLVRNAIKIFIFNKLIFEFLLYNTKQLNLEKYITWKQQLLS